MCACRKRKNSYSNNNKENNNMTMVVKEQNKKKKRDAEKGESLRNGDSGLGDACVQVQQSVENAKNREKKINHVPSHAPVSVRRPIMLGVR